MAIGDEARAVAFWERYRWNDTPTCVHCGDVDVYQMRNRQGERDARWRWRCRGCRKQYSVRVGNVMEGSNLPFRHWTLALWLWCSSKKGFASKQFQRMTGCSYKSALFVSHCLPHDAPAFRVVLSRGRTALPMRARTSTAGAVGGSLTGG